MNTKEHRELIIRIEVERFTIVSSRPFQEVIGTVNAGIAHPDLADLWLSIQRADTVAQMEKAMERLETIIELACHP